MEVDHPLLLLEKPTQAKAVCLGHRANAANAEKAQVAVFASADVVEPCFFCVLYNAPEPALTLMRVSYWFPSRHPSMRKAVALVTAVCDAQQVLV